ncbi:MAG: DUF2752 domain-containing protein [Oscillospiraceae bacterium]
MERRRRLSRLLGGAGLLLAAGLAYALWVRATGLALPCPFRAVTGLLCPGCGVTRLCLALLRGDWAGAWRANPALLPMLPILAALAVRLSVRYVREGSAVLTRRENALVWVLAALLAAWGILRNLI